MCTPLRRKEAPEALSHYDKILNLTIDGDDCFILSPQAIKSLDILTESNKALSSRASTSLYSVLNRCRTVCGQKLLVCWMKRPLINRSKIDERLSIVQFFNQNPSIRQDFYNSHLRTLPNLLSFAKALSNTKSSNLTLLDLLKAYRGYDTACKMSAQLSALVNGSDAAESVSNLYNRLNNLCGELKKFGQLIKRCIETDKLDASGNVIVKPGFNEDIGRVSLDIDLIETKAQSELANVADDLKLEPNKTLKLETDNVKGFAFKVTKKHESILRGKSEYSQLTNAKKDGFRFSNKKLLKLSSKYVDLRHEYATIVREVEEKVLDIAATFEEPIQDLGVMLATIDVYTALSVVAINNDYCRPMIIESECDTIEIIKMRHPCLELQPDVGDYVTNDIKFDGKNKKFYLITGPNMGGKSTFIKSVAICAIMAQFGSFVPAEWASISIVDGVYTRVGAGDRQLEGLSTFMEEMMDITDILERATSKSLVIIDELGRGTSTYDGFGLAWSISRHMATQTKCFTLFATHFHEITELENELQQVGNLHVTAHCSGEELTMLYQVQEGICAQSFGIHVARLTKFPERIVTNAENKLRQYEEVPGCKSKEEARECVKKIVKRVKEEIVAN